MPIYEYQCQICGARSEFIQKMSDNPMSDCVKCGSDGTLKRLISAPMIQFKGSGWYITDYAKKNSKGSSESADKNGSKPDSTKTESKKSKTETIKQK